MVTLVDERDEHAPAVERLLDVAFGEARWHKTCQRLRDGRSPLRGLSQVALAGDALVGTVRLWPVLAGRRRALLLGPLAVDPAHRDTGIGSKLMDEALRRAAAAGEANVLLVGDPEYYRRFGFRQDATSGLWLPGPVERKRFQAKALRGRGLKSVSGPVLAMAA
ncbi:MAG: N-acetyltransferase [Alphaproteobacteria bacterium]|nr:N-acetyltransferase [Alphaproteobacteria bacterium]